MTTLLVILWVVKVLILALLAAIKPERTKHSRFELQRRGDKATLRRERLLNDIAALQQFLLLLFAVLLGVNSYLIWGWVGIFYAVVTLVVVLALSRTKPVHRLAMRLYQGREQQLLSFVEKVPVAGRLLGGSHQHAVDQHLESSDQLRHLVESAGHILSKDQQTLLVRGLDWHAIPVSDVMTPREEIVSVKAHELLGPFVLNDLHQTGHTVFPVVRRDLDHAVGVLAISELLRVDKAKGSHTAEQVMAPDIYTVLKDAPLPVALHLLLSTRQPFLIVTADDDTTVGLVTLTDVLGALLGNSI